MLQNDDLSRAVLTFAFVKEKYAETGDPFDGLVSLFAPIAEKRANTVFNPKQFANDVQDYYGLKVNSLVAESLAPKLAKHGLLRQANQIQSHIQYEFVPPPTRFTPKSEKQTQEVLEYIAADVQRQLAKLDIALDPGDAINNVFERICRLEFSDILHTDDTFFQNKLVATKPINYKAAFDYSLAHTILTLSVERPDFFERIAEIYEGYLISEIIMTMKSPPKAGSHARGLTVYFDAPLILQALDFAGRERGALIAELFDDLRNMKASVAAFDHSVEEAAGILNAALQNIDIYDPRFDVNRRLRSDADAKIRAQSARNDFTSYIRKKHFKVVDFEKQYGKNYKFVSEEIEDDLFQHMPGNDYRTRQYDAKSIAHTMRIILAYPPKSNLLRSEAVFVSANDLVVERGIRYFRAMKRIVEHQAPPLLTDRNLAGIVWMAVGGAAGNISKRQLIANCAAAIAPRRDVTSRMIEYLKAWDDEKAQEYAELLASDRFAGFLMDRTLGQAAVLTPDNALKVAEEALEGRVEEAVRLSEERMHAYFDGEIKEKDRRSKEMEQKYAEAEVAAQRATQKLELQEKRLQGLEAEQRATKAKQRQNLEQILTQIAVKRGRHAGMWWCFVIYGALSGLVAACSLLLGLPQKWAFVVGIGGIMVFGAAQFFLIPEIIFGPFIRQKMRASYLRSAAELHVHEEADEYDVDWIHGRLINRK